MQVENMSKVIRLNNNLEFPRLPGLEFHTHENVNEFSWVLNASGYTETYSGELFNNRHHPRTDQILGYYEEIVNEFDFTINPTDPGKLLDQTVFTTERIRGQKSLIGAGVVYLPSQIQCWRDKGLFVFRVFEYNPEVVRSFRSNDPRTAFNRAVDYYEENKAQVLTDINHNTYRCNAHENTGRRSDKTTPTGVYVYTTSTANRFRLRYSVGQKMVDLGNFEARTSDEMDSWVEMAFQARRTDLLARQAEFHIDPEFIPYSSFL